MKRQFRALITAGLVITGLLMAGLAVGEKPRAVRAETPGMVTLPTVTVTARVRDIEH